jgi:hypothetical protein
MKFAADTKDSVLFIGGCIGMVTFGLLLPVLGEGFNFQLFISWAGVAGIGVFGGMGSGRRNGKTD